MAASKGKTVSERDTAKLSRLLRTIVLLGQRRRGASIDELCGDLGVSRATIKRDQQFLAKANIPVTTNHLGRYQLIGNWKDARLDVTELFAVAHTHTMIKNLAGSKAAAHYSRRLGAQAELLKLAPTAPHDPAIVVNLQQAMHSDKRISITYQGSNDDAARTRTVDPIDLRFSQQAWYLYANDVDKHEPRTFKLSRIAEVVVTNVKCEQANVEDSDHSVGVWQSNKASEVHQVRIRMHGAAARMAKEYPLNAKSLVITENEQTFVVGSVVGFDEVTRWVLRWLGEAEVLSPQPLRSHVANAAAQLTSRHQP